MSLKQYIRMEMRQEAPTRLDYFIARVRQIITDALTKPLTEAEWEKLVKEYPKLKRLYERQVITEKEMTRAFREKQHHERAGLSA